MKKDEITIEQVKTRLTIIMTRFSGKSETGEILRGCTITTEEILNLLESSLSAQKTELSELKKIAKQQARRISDLAQQPLI